MFIGGLVRNVLIFGGLAAGGVMAVYGAVRPVNGGGEQVSDAKPSPVVLNTARPPERPVIPLAKPVSLESGFGRTELTGVATKAVPINPLDELVIDRRWDVRNELPPPKPSSDLPPARASDEVAEPKSEPSTVHAEYDFSNLPPEARARANEGVQALKEGTAMLKEGDRLFRRPGEEGQEGRRKIREAANILRNAKEKLEAALRLAPDNRDLHELLREAKANIYTCMKHGM
ncbi:MAG: hypothetical protein KF696_02925 [Planctomycetes bacterium]|nr:hypothetical protein [Planctomycetota bacterium]MCW8134958.1 hypothetical protein [Planctomycetota bacterium]